MTASDCHSWMHRHVRKRKRLAAHRSFFSFSRSSGLCLKHSHLEEVLNLPLVWPINLGSATMPRYTFCNNWTWSGRLCPYTTWQRKWEQKARLVSHSLVEFQLMWINIKGVQVVMFDFEDHPTAWNWPGQVINQVDRAWKVPSFWRSAGDRLKRQKWKLVAGFVPIQDVRKPIRKEKCRNQVIAILYLIVTYYKG